MDAWFRSLVNSCHVDFVSPAVLYGDVLRDGDTPIFLVTSERFVTAADVLSRARCAEALGLKPPAYIVRMRGQLQTFRDVLYDGSEATTAFMPDAGAPGAVMYLDYGARGRMMKVEPLRGGVYHMRSGVASDMDVADALREALGGALAEPAESVAAQLAELAQASVLVRKNHFMDWQAWMCGAVDAGEPLAPVPDARAAWLAYHRRTGYVPCARPVSEIASDVTLDPDQRAALGRCLSGRCSLLEGAAGTGKSEVIRAFANVLESMGFSVLLLGSTNRAANALGGLTLHAACGARKEPWLSPKTIDRIVGRCNNVRAARLTGAAWVVLDEYSMLLPEHMVLLDRALSSCRNTFDSPFGGACVLVAGNIDQLGAVSSVLPEKFFFEAPSTPEEVLKAAQADTFSKSVAAAIAREAERHRGDPRWATPQVFKPLGETLNSAACSPPSPLPGGAAGPLRRAHGAGHQLPAAGRPGAHARAAGADAAREAVRRVARRHRSPRVARADPAARRAARAGVPARHGAEDERLHTLRLGDGAVQHRMQHRGQETQGGRRPPHARGAGLHA